MVTSNKLGSIKIITIKLVILPMVVSLLMFTFPIQVYLLSPLPALLPYSGMTIIIILSIFHTKRKNGISSNNQNINIMISVYAFLVIFHGTWQMLFNYISVSAALSSVVIYIFPLCFYWYFSKYAMEIEIRNVLFVIAICGLISGIYFAYDSYSMMILGRINDFSHKAIDYTLLRQISQTGEFNPARISTGSRSHGFLDKHAISAAWVAIGCFSALSLLPQKATLKRTLTSLIYGGLLVISLNFSSIVAFLFIIVFVEYKGYLLCNFTISKLGLQRMALSLFFTLLVSSTLFFYYEDMANAMFKNISYQTSMMFGVRDLREQTIIQHIILSFARFPENMLSFPPGFLIGDGFSHWGVIPKGGDWGLAESMHRFGLPFFLILVFGFFKLIISSIKRIKYFCSNTDYDNGILIFSLNTILYCIITSIHYTTWSSKSILPLIFISLALISKNIPAQVHEKLTKN
jgi:hypothetical protein